MQIRPPESRTPIWTHNFSQRTRRFKRKQILMSRTTRPLFMLLLRPSPSHSTRFKNAAKSIPRRPVCMKMTLGQLEQLLRIVATLRPFRRRTSGKKRSSTSISRMPHTGWPRNAWPKSTKIWSKVNIASTTDIQANRLENHKSPDSPCVAVEDERQATDKGESIRMTRTMNFKPAASDSKCLNCPAASTMSATSSDRMTVLGFLQLQRNVCKPRCMTWMRRSSWRPENQLKP